MRTVSYTHMRDNLADIMEEIEQGNSICFTRRGHAPFIIGKIGEPSQEELEKAKKEKRAKTVAKLKERHAATLKALADK